MNHKIETIKKFRHFLLRQIDGLTPEQLNIIPNGYNNNIIWNVAHLIAATQSLCYVRAGLPITVDGRYVTPFMPGTKPERLLEQPEIDRIKELSITSLDQLQVDVDQHLFTNYSPSTVIPKIYGVDVNTIDDAIDFLLYHEGFHSGYVRSLKHLV